MQCLRELAAGQLLRGPTQHGRLHDSMTGVRTGRKRGFVGLSWTARGCSQATLRPSAVGSDISVEAKMTGITPVAFTCTGQNAWQALESGFCSKTFLQ